MICLLVLSCVNAFAAEAKQKGRLSKGIDNLFYGTVEVPDNMKQDGEKPFARVTARENDGFGKGIARTVGGIFQLLTPWVEDDK